MEDTLDRRADAYKFRPSRKGGRALGLEWYKKELNDRARIYLELTEKGAMLLMIALADGLAVSGLV